MTGMRSGCLLRMDAEDAFRLSSECSSLCDVIRRLVFKRVEAGSSWRRAGAEGRNQEESAR